MARTTGGDEPEFPEADIRRKLDEHPSLSETEKDDTVEHLHELHDAQTRRMQRSKES